MIQHDKKQLFITAVLGFVLAAFGGWVYEEICVYVFYGYVYNRGMLHLPICPIYGFGAWGLYLLLRRVKQGWLFYLLSVVTASVFEYACSYLLELLFHRTYWSYAGWWLSVDDRISLVSSLIFGLLALLFVKGVLPLVLYLQKHVRKRILLAVSSALVLIIAADFAWVVTHYQ